MKLAIFLLFCILFVIRECQSLKINEKYRQDGRNIFSNGLPPELGIKSTSELEIIPAILDQEFHTYDVKRQYDTEYDIIEDRF
ncbi:hypothetical protein PVAND_016376 [Polypedilum vanderplanki]|uniref:Uncharacterized protein n=1 Tax=Polypedilum vanderplanki TaxID=319348 RepID=A0A9J6BEZ5_POLVA|nr:hypothetical protein PVAND_016376 [Polypedilum vanderplanki]